MTSAQRKLRVRKRKADANVARAKRHVKRLTRQLRSANRTLAKRQAARKKIK
jgi:multidrug resistance efflux pump